MRILITTPVVAPELGGPASFVSRFCEYLAREGHVVSVLSYADDPGKACALPGRLWLVRRTFLPRRIVSFFLAAVRLAGGTDLVLICEHPSMPSFLAARLLRRPVARRLMANPAWELSYRFGLTTDDPDAFLTGRQGWRVRLIRAAEELVLRRADLVVAVSHHLAETAARLGVARERIFVSYNLPPAADPSAGPQPAEARRRLGLAPESFFLLMVTRLINWKGIDTVIAVLADLPSHYRLRILGEGPMKADLERAVAERSLQERVTFTGRADAEQVALHMRAADLLVLNSLYEGLSHVLVEAMALELPIVASDVPGNRELIQDGDNGLLFPHDDRVALKSAIETVAQRPDLRRQFRERSLERLGEIRRQNSFERLLGQLEQVATARRPSRARPEASA